MKQVFKGKLTYTLASIAVAWGVIGLIFGWADTQTAMQAIWAGLAAFGIRRKQENYGL